MKSIEKQWDNYFEELKVDINDDERNILVGYAYIGHYASTYYMENDVELFNAINKIIFIIGEFVIFFNTKVIDDLGQMIYYVINK